jgi:hypothetical protein
MASITWKRLGMEFLPRASHPDFCTVFHPAVDILAHLLVLHITLTKAQERVQVGTMDGAEA